jgi:hypothetical protein
MNEAGLSDISGLSLGGGKAGGLLSGFTMGSMIAALFFSLVGLVYLKQGKADANVTRMVCGVCLLGFTFFVTHTLYIMLIGSALTAAPFIIDKYY